MSEITRETIEQASGDELNRLVERLVFGDDLRFTSHSAGETRIRWSAPRDFIADGNRERELVDEIVRRCGYVALNTPYPGFTSYHAVVEFPMDVESDSFDSAGDTQAEALCRAACLACLEEA